MASLCSFTFFVFIIFRSRSVFRKKNPKEKGKLTRHSLRAESNPSCVPSARRANKCREMHSFKTSSTTHGSRLVWPPGPGICSFALISSPRALATTEESSPFTKLSMVCAVVVWQAPKRSDDSFLVAGKHNKHVRLTFFLRWFMGALHLPGQSGQPFSIRKEKKINSSLCRTSLYKIKHNWWGWGVEGRHRWTTKRTAEWIKRDRWKGLFAEASVCVRLIIKPPSAPFLVALVGCLLVASRHESEANCNFN